MTRVTTTTQVFDAIQEAKAGASAFCTNFFPAERKLQAWIDHGELFSELRDRAAFFLKKDRDLWHLFFCAADGSTLQREITLLPCLGTQRVAIDLLGNEAVLADLMKVVESAGFVRYAQLLRLARACQSEAPQPIDDGVKVLYADKADCQAIMDLLECSFDRYADQLPMLYEIETAIEARQILAVKSGSALAAVLYFESQGFTSTIRYWIVAQQFRTHRFGSVLMRHYLAAQKAVRRFILWVSAANCDAVSKYRHYGYVPDGLVDHVLINRSVHP